MSEPQKTICHYILEMRKRPTYKVAQKVKINGQWQNISWQEYYKNVELAGGGFLSLNIKTGDRIALMANTRAEWTYIDLATLAIKASLVPIYQSSTLEDLEYILNNCEAKVLVIENKNQLKTWNIIKDKCPHIKTIICIEDLDNETKSENCLDYIELKKLGETYLNKNPDYLPESCKSVNIEDTATIIYTSGTTGLPKGVVLTHKQIMSELEDTFPIVGVTEDDTSLSFLPYAHILGRVEYLGAVYIGFTVAFAENIEKIKFNLLEICPTILVSVPRIFEKVYATIWTQAESNPLKMKLFKWAVQVGKKVGKHKIEKSAIPVTLFAEYQLAQKLVLGKIYAALGGKLRFAVSGGAPIGQDIAEFFHAAGIILLEGYGLTETTAAITVNTPYDYRLGSVGKPHGDTQIKIAEDGEILVKSKKVMKEYYKNPQATQEAIQNGWFATGDIGEILPSGDIKITDRKKDLIKTAGGKYVAPQRLENLLKLHPFISNVLIHGDQRKYIVALIALEKNYIVQYAKDHNIQYKDYNTLTQSAEIHNLVHKAIVETNTHLASFESIKKFLILQNDFTIEAGELTPSLKVKRKVLDQKYREQIEGLY